MRIERGVCVSACGACFNMQSTTLYFILNCLINEPLNYATLISILKYVKETFSRMYTNTRTHTYIRYTYIQERTFILYNFMGEFICRCVQLRLGQDRITQRVREDNGASKKQIWNSLTSHVFNTHTRNIICMYRIDKYVMWKGAHLNG